MKLPERLAPPRSTADKALSRIGDHPYATAATLGIAALAVAALVNRQLAREAERRNPPLGRFLEIDGVRLHYVERGTGTPLVLLHGNGSMIQDFETSGLLDEAAKTYRVIAFDRPGYGHSRRPRRRLWSPDAQADLLHKALEALDATPAIVLGHSWGASVAVAMGLNAPAASRPSCSPSGYYYPTARADVVAASGPAIPRSRRHPPLHALPPRRPDRLAGADAQDFGRRGSPAGVPRGTASPRASRSARRSSAPAARGARADDPRRARHARKVRRAGDAVVIVAGELDRLIDTERQSRQLHREVGHSIFRPVPAAGHMVRPSPRAR